MSDWKPAKDLIGSLLHRVEAQELAYLTDTVVMLTGLYGAWFEPRL